jgi:aminoglycoside phosphotransferase (APT) family kinase protein
MSGPGWRNDDPGLEATRARFAEWLATKLPRASSIQVAQLTRPTSNGFSNDTLFADLTWRESGAPHHLAAVVRLEPSGATVFPGYDLAAQFRIMETLWRTDVPVPRTFWMEEDRGVLGAPFYVMERVDGRIPTDTPPYHVAGWMTEVAPAERAAMWWSGLKALARIHHLGNAARGLGFLGPTPPGGAALPRLATDARTAGLASSSDQPAPKGTAALERQLEYYERYIAWSAGGRPQPTCDAALQWLVSNRPRAADDTGLCWGDARLGNMIFRDGRCVAVLDWEMAVVGDPEQDLAWWLYFDRHHSEGCDAERLAGLPTREETVRRYEELTGRPVRHLEYYEIFAAFRFAAIMIRVAQQLVARGILPPDSDFETNNTATRLLARMLAAG